MLPVLGQNRSRQCDVVLRIGKPPRQQFFIIEVQKRDAKPDINTFGGWLRKMDEVGANGLICVSEAGFPQSIIDDVALRVGPKVKLMTLERNETSKLGPFYLVPELVRSTYKIRNIEVKEPVFWNKKLNQNITFQRGGRILSNSGNRADAVTLTSIAEQCVQAKDPHSALPSSAIGQPIDVTYTLTATESLQYWLHAEEGIFRLESWPISFRLQRIDRSEPMIYSKWDYRQEFYKGALAWIASASFDVETHVVEMTVIFRPGENGLLQPSMVLKTTPKEV
jgi:hypothetical protein